MSTPELEGKPMDEVFSLRLRRKDRYLLDEIANQTMRSKGNVLRWLIDLEAKRMGIVYVENK